MHSNFITPPDYIETVLVLNASEEQIKLLATKVELTNKPYDVYFYRDEMNDQDWLSKVTNKADVILNANLKDPMEYFNK
jgi:hypothetical protein